MTRHIRAQTSLVGAALSPDGKTLAVGDHLGQRPPSLWETGSGKFLRALPGDPVRTDHLEWTSDGKRLVTSHGGEVRVWQLGPDQLVQTVKELQGYVAKPFGLSHDGTRLAVPGPKNKVRVFNTADGKLLQTLEAPPDTTPNTAAWSFDDKWIASVIKSNDSSCVWDVGSGKPPRILKTPGSINLCWVPTGGQLISLGLGGANVVDADTGKEERSLASFGLGWPKETAWSPDARRLIVTGVSLGTPVWNFETGKIERFLVGHTNMNMKMNGESAVSVAWSADGRSILTAGHDGQARFWDAGDGRTLGILLLLTENRHLALTPEGHYRGSPGIEGELVYVAATDEGTEILRPSEFAEKYGWKNDPEKVRLLPGADH